MQACARALALLKANVAEPDVVCFNTIISSALKLRDIDTLVVALREMEQQVLGGLGVASAVASAVASVAAAV